MKKSTWWPKWWVFLPVALPLVTELWIALGIFLHLDLMPVPASDPDPAPDYPAWLMNGYYAVYFLLLLANSWATLAMISVADGIMGTPTANPIWAIRLGVVLTVVAYCLALYLFLLAVRLLKRR